MDASVKTSAPAIMNGRRPYRSAAHPVAGRSASEVRANEPMMSPMALSEAPMRRAKIGSAESSSRNERKNAKPLRSEEHTSELQSPCNLVCRLLLEKKKK